MKIEDDDLKYILEHVFLPPQLPQEQDSYTHRKDLRLLEYVINTAETFTNTLAKSINNNDSCELKVWGIIQRMLKATSRLYAGGAIIQGQLRAALEHMDIDNVLPVFVEAQNAGIIFRKIAKNILTFEAFEVSLPSEVVMGTCGKIGMRFPTNPRLPFPTDSIVISTLANVLAYLSTSLMEEAIPFTKKGGEDHHEVRNTASPRFITEALAGIIRATPPTGQLNINTTYINKRLNDHVLWKSALKPWRRSSMWLVIRVAMQTTLEQWGIREAHGYKAFQVFTMASLLERAISRHLDRFPSDLLHTMNVKVVRRLCKLGNVVECSSFPTLSKASDTVRLVAETLGERWKEVQQIHENTVQWTQPDGLDFGGCLAISFPNSQDYLREVIHRLDDKGKTSTTFNHQDFEAGLRKSHTPRTDLSAARLPSKIASHDVSLGLCDFESWVQLHLVSWKQSSHRSAMQDCLPLKSIIDTYTEVASARYGGNPEQTSLMYLCILELWVALDSICLKWCPLLEEYSPEIAEDFLDPLLLPYPEQVERLAHVQHYLRSRHQGARSHSGRSLFQQVNEANSFQNQYFERCTSHALPLMELRERIRADAIVEKDQKRAELQKKNKSYAQLIQQAQAYNCVPTYSYSNGEFIQDHRPWKCQKCWNEYKARTLRVVPFEEPLPEDNLLAQPIIFELACPAPFAIWRDVTIKIISCSSKADPTSPAPCLYPLHSYPPLERYFHKPYVGHCVSLASSAKSLSMSHYGAGIQLPATESQVLFMHEGHFDLFDLLANERLDQRIEKTLRPRCTLRAEGLYAPLQVFLDDTNHSPNSVLASQSKCPIGVTLTEYTTFGQVRAGNRIQWHNIMRAIRTHSLPFSEAGVFALMVQSIWQAGPMGDAIEGNALRREAHVDLLDENFGCKVAEELLRSTKSIGSNWKQASFLAILIILALRLHAFSPHRSVRSLVEQLLDEARNLSMKWIGWLLHYQPPAIKVASQPIKKELKDYRPQALANVALVLRASFDVKETDCAQTFLTRNNAVMCMYAGMLISAVHVESFPSCLSLLASRNRRLTLKLEPHLIEACRKDHSILYDVGTKIWPPLLAESQWKPVESCQNRWWTSTQAEKKPINHVTLHMNIIEGKFLVNGKPLHQLPTVYREDPLYRSLFNDYVFGDVGPSQIQGMEFQGLYKTHEVCQVEDAEPQIHYKIHEIHFGMNERRLILLRRQGEDLQEYIPADELEEDLPALLSTHHCFWYSKDESAIEVRPQSQLWVNNEQPHWRVRLSTEDGTIIGNAVKSTAVGDEHLVDLHSANHSTIAGTLAPLEQDPRGVFLTVIKKEDGTSTISVRLPRHDLGFAVKQNELECLSVPGFVVDLKLAGIGCLFGLRSLLSLSHKDHRQQGRKIIVPKGSMVLAKGRRGHLDITIDSGKTRGYFIYDVDPLLGRLVGTRSMESDLFLVKLHALTSSHLPDPLTRRTGTVEALNRLASASSFSFYTISEEARSYLDDIARLAPQRSFYPAYLRVMETVKWNKHLPACAQHPDFMSKVKDILLHGRNMGEFIQDMQLTEEPEYPEGMDYLTNRTVQRDWIYSYHADLEPSTVDEEHRGRDSLTAVDSCARENEVFQTAKLTRKTTPGFPICKSLRDEFLRSNVVEGCQEWGWSSVKDWLRVPGAPSIAETWCTFYELCRAAQSSTFEITTVLAFQRYRGVSLELIASLIAVMNKRDFPSITLACPPLSRLKLDDGHTFDRPAVLLLIQKYSIPFEDSNEYKTAPLPAKSDLKRVIRAHKLYETAVKEESNRFANRLADYWPALPTHLEPLNRRLLNLTAAEVDLTIRPILTSWALNAAFFAHVQTVQNRLNCMFAMPSLPCEKYIRTYPTLSIRASRFSKPSLENLMLRRNPGVMDIFTADVPVTPLTILCEQQNNKDLRQLLRRLDEYAHSPLKIQYLKLLRKSLDALKLHSPRISIEHLSRSIEDSWESSWLLQLNHCTRYFDHIFSYLTPMTNAGWLMYTVGIWPEISPDSLLRSLSKQRRQRLPPMWTGQLINYATSIHDVKRAARVFQHARQASEARSSVALLEKELQYKRVWDPSEHPDWLLVEIDGDISIRDLQAEMARAMLHPAGDRNAIMQLNMGEGKSSVIVPIVAVSTANGDIFTRIMVPRAQLKQQFQILRRTITGLCDRRIVYLPFNRNLPLDAAGTTRIHKFLRKATGDGAIGICEPESALSLELLGLDKATRELELDDTTDSVDYQKCSHKLIELHLWFQQKSKDIIDESDDVLNVRQQVVYTTGPQQDLHSGPLRCMVIQKILGLLVSFLAKHKSENPVSPFLIETRGKSGFPSIRIRSDTARQCLQRFIKASIHDNDWPFPAHMKESVADFVTSPKPSSSLFGRIRSDCSGEDGRVMDTILILRGMIGCDILMHSLKERRWRVQYGLDLQRSKLAIPFRAKDTPSPKSEFGHPDVTILLTCLSYYYHGLQAEMIGHVLQALLSSDMPDLIYASWLESCWSGVPLHLRTVKGINLQDEELIRTELFPRLQYNKAVVDFYLNVFVFPKHTKGFNSKMSTSGWDIAIEKPNPTTGFSGTNDGRFLLPVTITQTDRDAQLHTNAKVISCIVDRSVSSVECHLNFRGSKHLLEIIHDLPSRTTVILDVGAQILDLSNMDFAKTWLAMYRDDPVIKAAVFFDEYNNLLVLTLDGFILPLIDSPYSNRLDQCLVYLDEAHTRGTDLRIPDTQAAVTLGPKLNKDKLVQGCMRMRRLGHGHKLVFMASEEVSSLIIQETRPKHNGISTEDVIVWSIKETWKQLQADLPAWVVQGRSFVRREAAWQCLSGRTLVSPEYISAKFHEKEMRSLEELYGSQSTKQAHAISVNSKDKITNEIAQRCQDFDSVPIVDARVDEEIEIELMHEKEVEREVERAPDAEPAQHYLHPNVARFVATGDTALCHRQGFRSAAASFSDTSLMVPREFNAVFSNIIVTEDFWHTIKLLPDRVTGNMYSFMRSVDWVVTDAINPQVTLMVIFSPYEVNQLLPQFRKSTKVKLHVFAAHSNLAVPSLEDLDFLTLPSTYSAAPLPRPLSLQLNLFSGSIYFRDYETYRDVCRILRLYFDPLPKHLEKRGTISASFFVLDSQARVDLGITGPGFNENALPFFQKMVEKRRFGREFGPSHLGRILDGNRLKEKDFVGGVLG